MEEKIAEKIKNKEYDVNETILDVENIKKAFANIKDEKLGMKGNEEEDAAQIKALSEYIDKFISCSLKDPSTEHIVRSVNMHNHTKPCKKYGPPCRFRFPRFPCLETIISIPSDVRYKDPEVASSQLKKSQALLLKVKTVLENDEDMKTFTKLHQDKIDLYMKHKKILQWISNHVDEIDLETPADVCSKDYFILEEYRAYFGI
jgi:hypothetical protein